MEIIDMPTPESHEQRDPNEILRTGYEFSIGDAIGSGFDMFKAKAGEFVGFTILVFIITLVASFIPFATLVVSAPLSAGYFIMCHHIKTGQRAEFNTFFRGFDHIGQLILYSLISGIFIAIGLCFLLIPGIYLAVAYSLASMFVVFYRFEFWDAMEWSRKVVSLQWFKFLGLVLVLGLLNLAGAMVFGLGLLITIPVSYCAIYVVFDKITNSSGGAPTQPAMPETGAPQGGYMK